LTPENTGAIKNPSGTYPSPCRLTRQTMHRLMGYLCKRTQYV
jgi:hypothetical protein